jgi:hypothetical protein
MFRITRSADLLGRHFPQRVVSVAMFGVPLRAVWFLALMGTLISELVPLSATFESRFSPFAFYSYQGAKLMAFMGLGFLTPLAWWHYKRLGIGVLFMIAITVTVEILQFLIPGHRTSGVELVVKIVLLLTGFVCGLDVRKYQRFTVGPLSVRFTSRHWRDVSARAIQAVF